MSSTRTAKESLIGNMPFSESIKTYISCAVNRRLLVLMQELREKLRTEYKGLPVDELIDAELYPAHVCIRINPKRLRHKKQPITELRCHARISSGAQCSRTKSDDAYCRAHQSSLPYGSIDDNTTFCVKRRGRRCKKEEEFQISEEDLDKYVQAILINIGEERYLLDQHDILYSENNQIAGILVDGIPQWT